MSTPFVLSVEDNDADFFLLSLALKECLSTVIIDQVRDGEEAVKFFKDPPVLNPDLILLDVNLPKVNGFEVLAVLRSLESLRQTPVIMFTTSSGENDKEKALALGATEYITKPSSVAGMRILFEEVCVRYLRKPPRQLH